MRVMNCGDTAWLIELDNLSDAISAARHLKMVQLDGVVDVHTHGGTVLVTFDDTCSPAANEHHLRHALAAPGLFPHQPDHASELLSICVEYGTRDLAHIARLHHTNPDDIIGWHSEAIWTAETSADHPGLWYLVGSGAPLMLPARNETTPHLEPGAIAVGQGYTSIHGSGGPSSWYHIGTITQADRRLLDHLEAGQRITFRPFTMAHPSRRAAHAAKSTHAA